MKSPGDPPAIPPHPLAVRASAEAVGTFALVLVGCGAIIFDEITDGALTHLGVSLAFGAVVTLMVYLFGGVSGAHINPAVTFGFATLGEFPWREVPAYVGAQLVAAVAAALVLKNLAGDVAALGATSTDLHLGMALVVEVALTFWLMFVIVTVAVGRPPSRLATALAIGGAVGAGALIGGPWTGASMNPARSLGPALWTSSAPDQWIYVAGPLLGALVAIAVFARFCRR